MFRNPAISIMGKRITRTIWPSQPKSPFVSSELSKIGTLPTNTTQTSDNTSQDAVYPQHRWAHGSQFACDGLVPRSATSSTLVRSLPFHEERQSATLSLTSRNTTAQLQAFVASLAPLSVFKSRFGREVIQADRFTTAFCLHASGIANQARKALLSTDAGMGAVRIEPTGLNIYQAPKGGLSLHKDRPTSAGQFGRLVVKLPFQYKGGKLVVFKDGKCVKFDFSADDQSETTGISWAAFHHDSVHEVEPVTAGQRVTLTYSLHLDG